MISLKSFSNFWGQALTKTEFPEETGHFFAMFLIVDLIALLKNLRETLKIVWENV
jgi:hypothetical protein